MRFQDSILADDQPTWRLWGEERIDGAVYTVYLKKVRYHSPSKSITTDSDDGISHLEWETVRVRFVKAGTLCRLVENLASPDTGEIESTYVNVFLATYRTFASPKQVLNLLIERYEELCQTDHEDTTLDSGEVRVTPVRPKLRIRDDVREQHCRTLRQALHVWLDQFTEDYDDPPNYPCLTQLEAFCRRVLPNTELDIKVHRKASQIRRPPERPPHRLGYPVSPDGSRETPPPPLVLKSASVINNNNNHPVPPSNHNSNNSAKDLNALPPLPPRSDMINQKYMSPPHGGSTQQPYTDFLDIPEAVFARQLTRMDCDLFKKVIPHQCLGAVWSRRDKSRDRDAASVVATVEQFNAVSYRVISTVLMSPSESSSKPQYRAKVIAKWIDIAQELRVLKNFSSLKAIISGLQSNSVYRLRRAWTYVPRDKLEIFEELARIFSGENNALAQRELLVREGTARFADTVGENDHHMQKVLQKHSENSRAISYGTIPYLGTFLTDLTMIDTAINDIHSDGLINFDKRRKEFEVLAQIKLLQGAANAYHIDNNARFNQWFDSVLLLDEREAFNLSCQLEPSNNSSSSSLMSSSKADNKYKRRADAKANGVSQHRKNDSIASTASSSSSSQFYETDSSLPSSAAITPCKATPVGTPGSSADDNIDGIEAVEDSEDKNNDWSSAASSNNEAASVGSSSNVVRSEPNPTAASASGNGHKISVRSEGASVKSSQGGRVDKPLKTASSSSSLAKPTPESPYKTPEFYIIRVSIDSSGPETEGVIMYKSIMIGNHERTREVIRNAMMKHGLEGSPDNYTLSQLLPDKELLIPAKANVYYAVSTQHDLNFVLREKHEDLNASLNETSDQQQSVNATPSGRKSSGRDANKARKKLLGLHL